VFIHLHLCIEESTQRHIHRAAPVTVALTTAPVGAATVQLMFSFFLKETVIMLFQA
jgi:hypothetical protein